MIRSRGGMIKALKVYGGHKPNWIYFILLLALCLYLGFDNTWQSHLWMVLVVFALTPLLEYFTHRYILHLPLPQDPEKYPLWNEIVHRIHYYHHEDPKAIAHIFAPWWFTLPLFVLYSGGLWWFSKNPVLTAVFSVSLIVYFLIYEWTHYMAHCDFYAPRNRYSRYLKKFHSWHHYKSEEYWYGITSPLADFLFKKAPSPHEVEATPLALKNRGRL